MEPGNDGRRIQQVLEVVQHQQEPVLQHLGKLAGRLRTSIARKSQSLEDRRDHLRAFGEYREIDEHRAIPEIGAQAREQRPAPVVSCRLAGAGRVTKRAVVALKKQREFSATSSSRPMSLVGGTGSGLATPAGVVAWGRDPVSAA